MTRREEKLIMLGDELRRIRKDLGMTQEEMAEQLDTDFRVISRYENGQAEMGALMYRQLMDLYRKMKKEGELCERIAGLVTEDRELVERLVGRLGGE